VSRIRAFILMILVLAPMLVAAPSATAHPHDAWSWVTVGSTNPGPGCWVDTTVELSSDSGEVDGVEVTIAFHVESDVIWTDTAYTGGDGIAYLGFDTGWVAAGQYAMLDINISGQYIDSIAIVPAEGAGCNDAPSVYEYGATITGAGTPSETGYSANVLPVPAKFQQRGLSCEYASLSMVMEYYGYYVSEYAFDEIVGWSDNPHWGYRGDINGVWGGTTDYGVYAAPLASAVEAFGFWGDVKYASGDASVLTNAIDNGHPIIVWLSLLGDPGWYEYTDDGSRYLIVPGQHAAVAVGYDDYGVYVIDPADGAMHHYDWNWFMSVWNIFDGMSLVIGPY